jgi:uncharacterized protein YprB with RNaseH-like and TPR domain
MALDYLRQYAPQAELEPAKREATRNSRPDGIETLIDGILIGGPDRACFVAETEWRADHRHGLHELGGLRSISPSQLALIARDPELAYGDLARAVFLDTETTGLSTGAGTYVFLLGAGYVDGDRFRVKQFFLREPGEELAFLVALDAFLRRFSMIVTFNGKAFDWPLLESRFIRQREFRHARLEDPLHLDLLHPARRMWKRRLKSCALSALEGAVLRVQRTEEDVPGWLIPSLYFQYLRTGNGKPLQGVFYHNMHDILSLAALAIHMDRVLSDPTTGLVTDAADFFCLGRLYERAGEGAYAITCYEEALQRSLSRDDRRDCLLQLARCLKRDRRWESAKHAWERLIEEGGDGALYGLIERAKYHEHVEREYMDALEDVQEAFQLAELHGLDTEQRKDLEHRQARLLNRVFQKRSWVGGPS